MVIAATPIAAAADPYLNDLNLDMDTVILSVGVGRY
jgi:hypothetical protein